MLTRQGCLDRRRRLWQAIPEGVEWLLVADPRHVYYLSNFLIDPFSFSAGERGLLLLERDEGVSLFADNFARRSAAGDPFVDREIVDQWYDHKHSVGNRDHALLQALKSVSERLYGRRGAVEAESLPVAALEVLALDRDVHTLRDDAARKGNGTGGVDLGTQLRALRRQKEPDEIELLRECMLATDAGHERAREALRVGMSEFEVYREVQSAALEKVGRPAIVYGDFRAVNAETPKVGGRATSYRIQQGDLFILDYSVVIDGYRSDTTNTLCAGKPTDELDMLSGLCLSALKAAEVVLRANVKAADVDAAVRRPIEEAGYGQAFPHHTGHGIGLGHPEPPIIVPQSTDTLLAGDVVTIEPGLYVKGIGGMRFEHNYLITNTGFERLSNHLLWLP